MRKLNLPHIAARLFNTPLLIERGKLDTIIHVLGQRMGLDITPYEPQSKDERRAASMTEHNLAMERRPGYTFIEGVAVIDVMGSLVHRSSYMDSMSGMTSYQDVSASLNSAIRASDVSSVMILIDSPGGEAAGFDELATSILASRGSKKITAVVSDLAASGAYGIAAMANEIVIPRTGVVGSVGVVMAHVDMSMAAEMEGIDVTYIYAGNHKIDGNPFEPLPDSVKASLQMGVDKMYAVFSENVAKGRGMSQEAVRATQAAMFTGADAVDIGFADRIGSESSVLTELVNSINTGDSRFMITSTGDMTMDEQDAALAAEFCEQHPEAYQLIVDEASTENAEAFNRGFIEGSTKQRARIADILSCEEAAGREELAKHIAFDTDMTVEVSKQLLGKSAKTTAAVGNTFLTEMERAGNPQIGLEPDPDNEQNPAQAVATARKFGIVV